MKTVKEVSEITGISIRTLRYYDEIGLLKPTQVTEAGYRLYDRTALEKLQEILFYRELEIPLNDIKSILENPNYDKKQALAAQKVLLEYKRNRLNGIIELISDVMEGVNTMSFGAFSREETEKIVNHTLSNMNRDALEEQIKLHGGEEAYKAYLMSGFENEQATADLIKWYGSKEKVVEAVLEASGEEEQNLSAQQDNEAIYQQFVKAREQGDAALAADAVKRLSENYKQLFLLDNARNILLDLAKEYLQQDKLAEVTDAQYGEGMAQYVAEAIRAYYGV